MFCWSKKAVLSMFILFSTLLNATVLKDVSYINGEFTLTFDSKVSPSIKNEINSSNKIKYNVSQIDIKNSSISPEVLKKIDVNDKYFKDIIIDNLDKNSISILTYSQYGYNSKVTYNNNVIKISQHTTAIPKRISNLTNKQLVITLDAGHGGHDSGARGFGRMEKEIALQVVLKLAENLKRDHNIILTRKDDTFIPLSERPQIGNKNNTDLFVSIHLNAASNTTANGAEIFYFSKDTNPYAAKLVANEEKIDDSAKKVSSVNQILGEFFTNRTKIKSANLATIILKNYIDLTGIKRRGIFGANFAVLRGSESASMLIELGFISNESDSAFLASDQGQEKVVIAIADSIRENFEE